jgi:hypothetical protein
MKLKHPNIVQLVGYCYETQHVYNNHEGNSIFAWNTQCLLCLECLPKGSLDKYISGMTLIYKIALLSLLFILFFEMGNEASTSASIDAHSLFIV